MKKSGTLIRTMKCTTTFLFRILGLSLFLGRQETNQFLKLRYFESLRNLKLLTLTYLRKKSFKLQEKEALM